MADVASAEAPSPPVLGVVMAALTASVSWQTVCSLRIAVLSSAVSTASSGLPAAAWALATAALSTSVAAVMTVLREVLPSVMIWLAVARSRSRPF